MFNRKVGLSQDFYRSPGSMPTQPPIRWITEALSLEVKLPGCEAEHSPPSSAEVKEWVDL